MTPISQKAGRRFICKHTGTPLRDVNREPIKDASESSVDGRSPIEEWCLVDEAISVLPNIGLRQRLEILQKQGPRRAVSAGIEQQDPHRLLSIIYAKAGSRGLKHYFRVSALHSPRRWRNAREPPCVWNPQAAGVRAERSHPYGRSSDTACGIPSELPIWIVQQ